MIRSSSKAEYGRERSPWRSPYGEATALKWLRTSTRSKTLVGLNGLNTNPKEERSMRKTIVGTTLAAFVVLALSATGLAEGKKVTLTGYLIDQMCGGAMKDVSKAAEHTKDCALMDHCASSGYGIFAD